MGLGKTHRTTSTTVPIGNGNVMTITQGTLPPRGVTDPKGRPLTTTFTQVVVRDPSGNIVSHSSEDGQVVRVGLFDKFE